MSRSNSAFTLIEVTIAAILILLALVPLFSLMITGHRGTAFSVRQSQASHMAMEAIEAVETLPYDLASDANVRKALENALPTADVPSVFTRESRIVADDQVQRLRVQQSTGTVDANHQLRYKIVQVTVTWKADPGEPPPADGTNRNKVTFSTMLSKLEMVQP